MKKTTKVTKTLTPAKKSAKAVIKTPAVPAVKVEPTVVVTTISANFDVGFGNALYVRGEGSSLSWDKGTLMKCSPDGKSWSVQLGESAKPFVFKFVINDEVWSGGEDYVAASGSSVTLAPTFPGW